MKIGVFGGVFNPPHKMHKQIAVDLIKNNYVNKIIYVPVGDDYKKEGIISFNHRINMVNLIIDNEKTICSRIGNTGYTYTYQVLDYFKKLYKEDIYFICGLDNLKELQTWKNYQYILTNYKLLIIKRNNENIDLILNKYKKYIQNIVITNIDKIDISSSIIRNNINNNILMKENLDEKVYRYIMKNNLYKS